MGVSQNRGLIIRTPNKVPLIFGNSHIVVTSGCCRAYALGFNRWWDSDCGVLRAGTRGLLITDKHPMHSGPAFQGSASIPRKKGIRNRGSSRGLQEVRDLKPSCKACLAESSKRMQGYLRLPWLAGRGFGNYSGPKRHRGFRTQI